MDWINAKVNPPKDKSNVAFVVTSDRKIKRFVWFPSHEYEELDNTFDAYSEDILFWLPFPNLPEESTSK